MEIECCVNKNKVLDEFKRRFGITGIVSPMFFIDMQASNKWLREQWDSACELDRLWTTKQEIVRNQCVFVTRDEHYDVKHLSIAVHGGWDEYDGASAQRKYDAITRPYRMAAYND